MHSLRSEAVPDKACDVGLSPSPSPDGHIEAEGARAMRDRLWLAFCCAGALLLAATPLLATNDPSTETIQAGPRSNEKYVGPTVRVPSPLPATPAGDDDMPDRTSPRRGSTDDNQPASVAIAAGEGWRTSSSWTGWSQSWFRIISLWFR